MCIFTNKLFSCTVQLGSSGKQPPRWGENAIMFVFPEKSTCVRGDGEEGRKAGGTVRECCQSDPREGRDGWVGASQRDMQGEGCLARLLGGPQAKGATTGGLCTFRERASQAQSAGGVVLDFRVQKLGSLVSEAPHSWGSVRHILLAATCALQFEDKGMRKGK